MKKLLMILTIAVWSFAGFANVNVSITDHQIASIEIAKDVKAKFKVKGNCGMCKARIEKTALAIEGVSKAEWNNKTTELKVTYSKEATSVKAIQKAIAKVGHDTGDFKAADEVYNALPGCCHYDRTK